MLPTVCFGQFSKILKCLLAHNWAKNASDQVKCQCTYKGVHFKSSNFANLSFLSNHIVVN